MAQFTARGYGGYEDVVGSAPHSPDGQHLDHLDAGDWNPTEQPGQEEEADGGSSGSRAYSKQQESPRSETVSTTLEQASSILARVPGAKTVSYANAGLFGGCGMAAALVAWLAGLSLLVVLLARWYLPAHEARHELPLQFDYAAGPQAAVVWAPLLKPTAVADSLTAPGKLYAPAAAGLRGLLSPGSSTPRSSSSGRTGLGFSPLSRHSKGSSSDNSTGDGFWARVTGSGRRRRRAAARAAAAAAASTLSDAGSGVLLPEGDWLVPMKGETSLAVELEMPGSPQPDIVQVTAELYSPQGVQLGRWTTTWVPKPQPLLFRMIGSMLLGPWRILGLVSDTTRVELGLVEAFQNPTTPPGGWASLPGYRRFVRRQQQQMQAWDEYGSDVEDDIGVVGKGSALQRQQGSGQQQQQEEDDEEGLGHVPGPRALWLRVSLSGRCYGQAGPPRVYNARAKLDIDRGLFDRMLSSMRPSLMTALLVLTVGGAFMCGGAGTAAVLLYVAYLLYRWGSRIGIEPEEPPYYQQQEGVVPGYGAPWNLDDFVEQEGDATASHMDQQGRFVDDDTEEYAPYAPDDYMPHSISEEGEGLFEEGEALSEGEHLGPGFAAAAADGSSSEVHSDEVFEEPDYAAADEMYASPRGLDADRALSPFGGSYRDRPRSIEGAAAGRRGSGSISPRRQAGMAAAPAAEAAALGAAAVAPPATPSTGFASSRLWSVLAGGSSPAPPPQQSQQPQSQPSQQQQQWGYSGPEDLPPSLARGGSNGGAATGAVGAAAAGAGPIGAAGGSRGWGKGETVLHQGEGSSGEEEVYVDGADIDAVGAGVAAATGAQRSQEARGGEDVEEYQEASEEIEAAGVSAADPDAAWKRQLLEESDDEQTSLQQQQDLKQHSKVVPEVQQQELPQQASNTVLLKDELAAKPVKRRFGFRFRS